MPTLQKEDSHRKRGASYELHLHRQMIESLEEAIEKVETALDYATTVPYKRSLPSSLAGKFRAGGMNLGQAKVALEESLEALEEEYGVSDER